LDLKQYEYYRTDLGVLYLADCLTIMPMLEPVDLVVADPFYGSSGRDGSVHLNRDNIIGNRMSSDSLIWFVRSYSKELFRLLKHDSHCYIFSDWRKFKDIQIAFETNGWELRSLIVWDKGNGMGEYWRSTHEFVLFFTKRKPRKLNSGGCMNVLRERPTRGKKKLHDYEKPASLLEKFITASSHKGDTALDPFAGSGTAAVVCERLNRKWIGIEIEEKYCEIAAKRIEKERSQLKLF